MDINRVGAHNWGHAAPSAGDGSTTPTQETFNNTRNRTASHFQGLSPLARGGPGPATESQRVARAQAYLASHSINPRSLQWLLANNQIPQVLVNKFINGLRADHPGGPGHTRHWVPGTTDIRCKVQFSPSSPPRPDDIDSVVGTFSSDDLRQLFLKDFSYVYANGVGSSTYQRPYSSNADTPGFY
jgi:hypothetical protein